MFSRISAWAGAGSLSAGCYSLRFHVAEWFGAQQRDTFYPEVKVTFNLDPSRPHYHVPLLLGPYGMSTYRGS